MEVQKEAQRIMTMSVWKMYHSRMQRGGLRLHRSLQLSLVMRNARDLYLSAKLEEDDEMAAAATGEEDSGAPSPPLPPLEGPPPATPSPQALEERLPRAPLEAPLPGAPAEPEPMETQQQEEEEEASAPSRSSRTSWSRAAAASSSKPSRKRRSSSLGKMGAAEAGLVPSKKAKLAEEEEGERQPQRQEGPFPSLARVLQDRFSGLILAPKGGGGGGGVGGGGGGGADEPRASCRQGDGVLSILVRAVVAF